jgi:hypothetical protein
MVGDCMSSGNRWSGVTMVGAHTILIRHELTDAS